MTAVTPDVDLTILEALDFDPTLPCEHSAHEWNHGDSPGKYLIRLHPPCGCTGHPSHLIICERGWNNAAEGLHCQFCQVEGPRSEFWTLVAEI